MISVSENFLAESEWFFLPKQDLSLPSTRYLYLRWPFFFMKYGASQEKRKEAIARSFNFTVRYTDDVMSLNNARFGDFVDHIYLTEHRNHKLWNIVSTERYILHMQVLLECCYI
jgi:hypothetical protein